MVLKLYIYHLILKNNILLIFMPYFLVSRQLLDEDYKVSINEAFMWKKSHVIEKFKKLQ
jgi:hypothetical protein